MFAGQRHHMKKGDTIQSEKHDSRIAIYCESDYPVDRRQNQISIKIDCHCEYLETNLWILANFSLIVQLVSQSG